MPDVFSPSKRSDVMSRIRGRGNRDTELILVSLFREHRITGWRRHVRIVVKEKVAGGLPPSPPERLRRTRAGEDTSASSSAHRATADRPRKRKITPDFVFPRAKLVVFVDGCFWHCCPKHSNIPANNREFWEKKLGGNVARDRFVNRELKRVGWRVIRIWEHDLVPKRKQRAVARIERALKECVE